MTLVLICASVGSSWFLISSIFFSMGPWACLRVNMRFLASSRSNFTPSSILREASYSWTEGKLQFFHFLISNNYIQNPHGHGLINQSSPCFITYKQTTAHHPWLLLLQHFDLVQMFLLLIVPVHVQLVPLIPLLGLLQEGNLLIQKGLSGTQQTAICI